MGVESQTMEKRAAVKNGAARMMFTAIAIGLEVAFLVFLMSTLNEKAEWAAALLRVAVFALILFIYNRNQTASMKMPWLILIMAFPILGVVLYLLIGLSGATRKMRRRFEEIDQVLLPLLEQDAGVAARLKEQDPDMAGLAHYLKESAGYPV